MVSNQPISDSAEKAPEIPEYTRFDTLSSAYAWANNTTNDLIGKGHRVVASVIYSDLFRPPRSRQIKLIGVSQKAGKECARLAPGGFWWVHCGTVNNAHRFMAWYSKYTPYAYAMMCSESGFEAMGIDYQSINSYFKSCMGFVDIGQGYGDVNFAHPNIIGAIARGEDARAYSELQEAHVIEDEDLAIYERVYHHSMKIKPPSLPFDEAYQPACVFVAVRRPDLFYKFIAPRKQWMQKDFTEDWRTEHVRLVCEAAGLPQPVFPK